MADQYTVQVKIQGQNNLSAPVNQATQSLNQLNQQAQRSSSAFNGIKTAMAGAFAGVSLAAVKGLAEDLYATGMEAQRAGNLFRSFGAQVGDTSALLERLRATTRGVVDDTTLMNAASTQLSMGLAQSASDVERLMNIGVTFAQAMGQDVNSSLENLNMILANQSYLRLDSLGISSSQVRELAERYKAAGMDSSEAFTAAFLDVAEGKLPQMAAVADATVTEIQKLQVSLDNWWADFGNRFAQGVNGLIGIATQGGLAISAALFGNTFGQAMARGQDDEALTRIAQQMGAGNNFGFGNIRQIMSGALNAGMSPTQMSEEQLRALFGNTMTPSTAMINQAALGLALYQAQQSGAAFGPYTGGATDAGYYGGRRFSSFDERAAAEREAYQAAGRDPYINEVRARSEDLQRLSYYRESGLFSRDEVVQAQAWLWTLERGVDTLKNMNADESTMRQMEMLRDYAREWTQEIEDGAARLEGLNLAGLFGQTDGGRMAEIDNAFATFLEAGGASQDIIDAYMLAAGMDSGTITDLSQQFETDVLPQLEGIYAQFGADAAIAARTSYEAALQQAAMDGSTAPLDLTTALGYTPYGAGAGMGGTSFQVNYGDDWNTLINRSGLSQDQIMQAAGITNPRLLLPGSYTYGGGMGGDGMIPTDFLNMDGMETAMLNAESSMANIETSASGIETSMTTATDALALGVDKVFGKRYTLEIDLSVLGKDKLSQLVAEIVQANGGTAPGTSPYGGRSGSSLGSNKKSKP